MTIVYAHCFSGASGDMFLGAIIDAGVDPEALREELAKVPIRLSSVFQSRRRQVWRDHALRR